MQQQHRGRSRVPGFAVEQVDTVDFDGLVFDHNMSFVGGVYVCRISLSIYSKLAHSTVDIELHSDDVIRRRRSQEQNRIRDFLRLTHALGGNAS